MKLPAVLSACLMLVAACASTPPQSGQDQGEGRGPDRPGTVALQESNVDVDTPELRRQKQRAGIEDCGRGEAAPYDGEDALPDVTLPCLGGGPEVSLTELRGPLVINLFAQWCGPCRAELPYYQQLHEQGGDKVRVLGIDYLDTQPTGALELAAETGVTFPLLADPSGVLRTELRVRGLPGVVFVDGDGRVTEVAFTIVRDYVELTDLVEEHLGVRL